MTGVKELIIISNHYPYYIGEDWMHKELKEGSTYFDKIILYPLEKKGYDLRWVPENCEVRDTLCSKKFANNKVDLVFCLKIMFTELFRSGKFFYILTHFKSLLRDLHYCKIRSELLMNEVRVNISLKLPSGAFPLST